MINYFEELLQLCEEYEAQKEILKAAPWNHQLGNYMGTIAHRVVDNLECSLLDDASNKENQQWFMELLRSEWDVPEEILTEEKYQPIRDLQIYLESLAGYTAVTDTVSDWIVMEKRKTYRELIKAITKVMGDIIDKAGPEYIVTILAHIQRNEII